MAGLGLSPVIDLKSATVGTWPVLFSRSVMGKTDPLRSIL